MIELLTDHSHRAVQAKALYDELAKFELNRNVIITCGLEVVADAVAAKGQGDYLVSIGNPEQSYDAFDALVLPNHEPFPQHQNIIPITGLLNEFSPESLKNEGWLSDFPSPRITILLGGKHVGGDVTQADIDAILAGFAGTKLVSTSRRTNETLKIEADFVYNFNRDGQDANPYLAMLSAADAVVVTADSARMMSEAASCGKPVYIFSPEALHFCYAALRDKLIQGGYAHNFTALAAGIAPTKLLVEARRVAELVANLAS